LPTRCATRLAEQ